MPAASTGYEVVTQTLNASGTTTLTAPSDTFVVWAFAKWNTGPNTGEIVQDSTIERVPTFDGQDRITAVGFQPSSTDYDGYIVCVGG